eukprot:1138506-Pelagomonas_calceolata.AAC.19
MQQLQDELFHLLCLNASEDADLFIGIHQDERVLQLILVKDGVELLTRRPNPLVVRTIHDVNNGLGVRVVTSPVGPDTGHCFHVEPNGCSMHIEPQRSTFQSLLELFAPAPFTV